MREDFEQSWQSLDERRQQRERQVDDETEKIREEFEASARAKFREIEDAFYELEDKQENLEEAYSAERDAQIEQLETRRDALFEEKMAPLEESAKKLDTEIEARWAELDELYQEQSVLTDQLGEVEKRVRDLDREAEFGLLGVISGAMEKAEELERSGGLSDFGSFLPQMGNNEQDQDNR